MHTIICTTRFDITATGVVAQYKENGYAYNLHNDQPINDRDTWTHCRNQQRNWETINQVISLRCFPEVTTKPKHLDGLWIFEFNVQNLAALCDIPHHDLNYLIADADGVPMITGLDEKNLHQSVIVCRGNNINTWFELQQAK